MMILTLLTDESHGKQKWNNSIAQAVDTMMPLNLWLLRELNICFRKAFFPGRFFIVVTTPLTDLTILHFLFYTGIKTVVDGCFQIIVWLWDKSEN